jgi:hypothetical protein
MTPDDDTIPALNPPLTPGDPGSADVKLEARTDGKLARISPLIYGTNGAPEIDKTHQTVVRLGGNRFTAYNWENNASNAGSDWMFQNDGLISDSNEPAKPILDAISESRSHAAATLVTIPIVDYVAADKNGDGDVRNSGGSYLSTRFKQNKPGKGAAFGATPDASDAFVYEDEFAAFLEAHASPDAQVLFSLDNEPDLWSSTHAEVHPDPVTYAELWQRNHDFAKAIKQAWAEAEVTGFVSYGWNGYVNLQNASDANGRDFIEWYLDQAKAAEASEGLRLIDYLDLHWYPEAQGGGARITDTGTSPAEVDAREQAPRSLWDESYEEVSWVRDNVGGAIKLLPRLHEKIDAHYPGTKLAFTEWNYGGGNHISGALATADVLGIFGRDGVALATFWGLAPDESFTYAAFRAYRNYDGSGAAFGNVSLEASTSDVASVTVYASLDAANPKHVVLVVINKATTDKTAGLQLAHPDAFDAAQTYVLKGDRADVVKAELVPSSAQNAWKLMLPAQSVTIVVPQGK